MPGRAELLLPVADDELVVGWRNSEWTGIAPFLEEDVAFSSIAQNEIGHAKALYEVVAEELGTDADALAFERDGDYRCCPLVELKLVPDWASTIARHFLYELADMLRIEVLTRVDDAEVSGVAARIEREEVYHRLHAQMWVERLLGSREGRQRLKDGVLEVWPYALGVLRPELNPRFVALAQDALGFELPQVEPVGRGSHLNELSDLVREMTEVRRFEPAGRW